MLNSTQFVAMNTFTLKDLSQQNASSGNSFLSMIMMLFMSIGVALAGTLINLFTAHYGVAQVTTAFQMTFYLSGCHQYHHCCNFLKNSQKQQHIVLLQKCTWSQFYARVIIAPLDEIKTRMTKSTRITKSSSFIASCIGVGTVCLAVMLYVFIFSSKSCCCAGISSAGLRCLTSSRGH